jgi:hypothetical protein
MCFFNFNKPGCHLLTGILFLSKKTKNRDVGEYKFVPVHSMKAHKGNRSIAPTIFNLGTRSRSVVKFTHRPIYPRERDPARIGQGAEWAPEAVWRFLRRKNQLSKILDYGSKKRRSVSIIKTNRLFTLSIIIIPQIRSQEKRYFCSWFDSSYLARASSLLRNYHHTLILPLLFTVIQLPLL